MKRKHNLLFALLLVFFASGQLFAVDADSLISHWMLDEGSDTIVNDAVTGGTGYLLYGEGATWVDGAEGGAIDLSMATDTASIVIPDSPELSAINFTDGAITVSLLARFDPGLNGGAQQQLFLKGSSNHNEGPGSNGTRYEMYGKYGKVYWVIDDDQTKVSLGANMDNFEADVWAHLVGVRDTANGKTYIYVNGKLAGEKVDGAGAIDVDTIPLILGSNRGVNKLNGSIDDVKIFDQALSPEDILALYDSYSLPPVGPLVSHWKLDEGTDTIVNDAICRGTGYLQYSAGAAWVEGIDGGALDLSNATDSASIIVPDSPETSYINFTDGAITVSLLAKFDPGLDGGAQQQLLLKGSSNHNEGPGSNGTRYEMYGKYGKVYWVIDDDQTKVSLGASMDNFEANEWAHLVGVRDTTSGNIYIYVNGQLAGEKVDGAGAIDVDTIPLILGSNRGVNKLNGSIDDVKIFDEALSPEEILAMYDSYSLPPVGPLVSHWKLDEGADTIVNDAICGATGYLQNGAGAEWIDGIDGGAIDLSIATDSASIIVPDSPETSYINVTDGPVTVSVLVKCDPEANGGAQQQILLKGSNNHVDGGAGANGTRYELYAKNGGFYWVIDDDETKVSLGADLSNYIANEWAHLVGVRDTTSGNTYIYLNGQLAGEKVDGAGAIDVDTIPLIIGGYWNGNNKLAGAIDDVRIFDEALSADDILALYDSYTWPVIVLPGDDCSLASLSADPGGDITLADNAGSVVVPAGTTIVTFTATTTDAAAVVTAEDLTFDASGIADGSSGTAIIHVTAEDGSSCEYTITVNMQPSDVEQSKMDMIEVYPNPATSVLTVTNVPNARISIYGISGALIRNVDTHSNRADIDIADLNAGVYMMKIKMKESIKIARFIKR